MTFRSVNEQDFNLAYDADIVPVRGNRLVNVSTDDVPVVTRIQRQ